jgi:hypothetical protein
MEPLKLAAFDADDLSVVSAHLQDAVIRVGDVTYLPEQRRFVLVGRRFDWEAGEREPRRRLTGCHFDRVLAVKTRGIDRSRPDDVLNLLAITFEAGEAPSGAATLHFAGDACIRLEVECIESLMKDLGPIWAAEKRPAHDLERA